MRREMVMSAALMFAAGGEVHANMPTRVDVERFASAVTLLAAAPRTSATTEPSMVARTPGGRRYHRVGCRSALGAVQLLLPAAAQAGGLDPCRRCLGPKLARRGRADPHGHPEGAASGSGSVARPWDLPDGRLPAGAGKDKGPAALSAPGP